MYLYIYIICICISHIYIYNMYVCVYIYTHYGTKHTQKYVVPSGAQFLPHPNMFPSTICMATAAPDRILRQSSGLGLVPGVVEPVSDTIRWGRKVNKQFVNVRMVHYISNTCIYLCICNYNMYTYLHVYILCKRFRYSPKAPKRYRSSRTSTMTDIFS